MRRLLITLALTPVIASLALCLGSLKFAGATCPGTNSCELTGNASEYFTTVGNPPTHAEFTINAKWHHTSTPFLGFTEKTENTYGLTNVQYDPEYFFPSVCDTSTGVNITVQCDRDGICAIDHHLNTILQVGVSPNYSWTLLGQGIYCP
jgi:hypothetical protein